MDTQELTVDQGTLEDRVIQALLDILDSKEFQELVVTQVSRGRPVYLDIAESPAFPVLMEPPVTVVNPVIREYMVRTVAQVIREYLDTRESLVAMEYLVTLVIPEWTGNQDIVESLASRALVAHRATVESGVSRVIQESKVFQDTRG